MTAATTPRERWHLRYLPALDGLRGIAIILVLLEHGRLTVGPAGGVGVTLFFVLSGFLITSLLIQERDRTGHIELAAFYWRRVLRLLPGLVVVLLVSAGTLVALDQAHEVIPDLVPAVLYYANWAIIERDLGIAGHTWSLSIEEQFYVVWPLAFGLLLRSSVPARWLVVAIVIVMIARPMVALVVGQLAARRTTFTVADALLLGCLLAFVLRSHAWRPSFWLVAVSVAVIGIWSVIPSREAFAVIGLTMVGLASTVLVAAAATSEWFTWRPLVALGAISYGVYLWHWPVMYIGGEYLPSVPMALVFTVVTISIAGLSYRYVELPFLRMKKRWPYSVQATHGPN
jgi:peptidoglycan/LPS O-acetylase OafA/YrhL